MRFSFGGSVATQVPANFGQYDATISKNKRKAPDGILRSEDSELTPVQRRKLLSAARDMPRNFALAAWMIRKHLDYVSSFSFRSTSGSDKIDNKVEAFVKKWSKAANCDVAGRHPLRRIIRLAEARRTVDGDVFLMRMADGRLQAIEGDRVRTPEGGMPDFLKSATMLHGVLLAAAGRAKSYCVCRRMRGSDQLGGNSSMVFERLVPAQNIIHHGYFDRFDQVRGISPLAPALNTLRDTYEGFDLALAKLKVSQMFGLVFYREAADSLGNISELPADDDEEEEEEADSENPRYKVDFGAGPQALDLDAGDKAEFLESKNPSSEFQSFTRTMISVAMKALDIPFTFYDETASNYNGSRQASNQYEHSAEEKRADNKDLLDDVTRWRLEMAIDNGEPGLDGVRKEDLIFDHIPRGNPWLDPLKEVQADIAAVGSCLTSRQRSLKSMGVDFYDVARELAAEKKFLEGLGLPSSVGPANAIVVPEDNQTK